MSRDFRIKSKSISFLIYQEREREKGGENGNGKYVVVF